MSHTIDTVLRLKVKHHAGHLARLTKAIADQDGLIGEVATISVGEDDVVRDVTIETHDDAHTERVVDAVRALDAVEILSITDRVFDWHRGGKIHQRSQKPISNVRELRQVYTPGVGRVALAIKRDPARAWDYTGIGTSVGIYTNGTRVLGLGNLGPVASMPVMEGKAALYEQLVGLSATPILVDATDPKQFVEAVLRTAPTFGAIHLEDIRSPDCFEIEAELRSKLRKPVIHDDQHGTATVALAAVLNACQLSSIDLRKARVGQIGLGAAGAAITTLLCSYGVRQMLVCDPDEAALSRVRDLGVRCVPLETILLEADIVIATTGRGGLIPAHLVQRKQVILALSNPVPEIRPDEALAAGAAFAGDGRSINNALAFPGLVNGLLLARCRTLRPEMLIAAAEVIARMAAPGDLVPNPLDRAVHAAVTDAVRAQAHQLGLTGTCDLG